MSKLVLFCLLTIGCEGVEIQGVKIEGLHPATANFSAGDWIWGNNPIPNNPPCNAAILRPEALMGCMAKNDSYMPLQFEGDFSSIGDSYVSTIFVDVRHNAQGYGAPPYTSLLEISWHARGEDEWHKIVVVDDGTGVVPEQDWTNGPPTTTTIKIPWGAPAPRTGELQIRLSNDSELSRGNVSAVSAVQFGAEILE